MKKSLLVLVTSALFVTMFPGAAKAAPSDTTVYPLICGSAGTVYVYLEFGVTAITITNPNNCGVNKSFNFSDGSSSTWTYSETISGTTTPRTFVPGAFFETGAIGILDSFTLTQTSTSIGGVRFVNGTQDLYVYFNKQIDTLSPNPIGIGQQVTVTGSNLSSVTSLSLYGPTNFYVTTANRTATQLTFTVPLTVTDLMFGTIRNVSTGNYRISNAQGKTLTLVTAAPSTTVPGAPTIGLATTISPTSASVAFLAPASNGGATIETYTATSSPGSITGLILQAGSGTITITGLTSSTAYTFSVTASNNVGTSSGSSSTVSLTTPPSAEELAAQEAATVAAAASAAKAAADAAVAKHENEKRSARTMISSDFKSYANTKLDFFKQAEINGITAENLEAVQAEITALPEHSSGDIAGILKIARKHEVVGMIASGRVTSVYSDALVEIGLIPANSKHKAALTAAIKKLPASERSSYAAIKAAIDAEMAEIQARINRSKAILTRIASHRSY